MKTLDNVIREVSKRNGDLDKEIYHYLMMYRFLLRKQAEEEEKDRRKRPFVINVIEKRKSNAKDNE